MPQVRPHFWFSYFDLACALFAAALWYLFPTAGPWPLLIALLPWGGRFVQSKRPGIVTPYTLLLLLFAATAVLSLWAAHDIAAAWPKFWRIIGAILLFYAVAHGLHAGVPPHFYGWLFTGFGAILTLYFAATHDWVALPSHIPALTTFGQALQAPLPPLPGHRLNPNVAGGMLAFAAPFAVVTAVTTAQARQRAALLVAGSVLLLIVGGLLLSSSRGAWLALFVALGLGAVWELLRFLAPHPARRRWYFLACLLLGSIALAFLLTHPAAITLLRRVAGGQERLDVLRNSLILVQDYPFIGAGLGGFMMLYVTYAMLLHVGYIVHTHNLFLDVAIEQGTVALLLLAAAWLIFAMHLWRSAGRQQTRAPWLFAAALALLTILLHSMLDDIFYGSRALLLLFVPLAFTMTPPTPARTSPPGRRSLRWSLGITLLTLLTLLLAGWQQQTLRARWLANLAAVAQSRAELALYSWPEWPLQDATRRELDLAPVIANYRRALSLDATLVSAHRRLGQIYLSLAEYEAALAHLAVAYAAQPWDNATRQLYGEALIVNGQVTEGAALWATVSNRQNQLLARSFWYEYLDDAQRAQWVQQGLP